MLRCRAAGLRGQAGRPRRPDFGQPQGVDDRQSSASWGSGRPMFPGAPTRCRRRPATSSATADCAIVLAENVEQVKKILGKKSGASAPEDDRRPGRRVQSRRRRRAVGGRGAARPTGRSWNGEGKARRRTRSVPAGDGEGKARGPCHDHLHLRNNGGAKGRDADALRTSCTTSGPSPTPSMSVRPTSSSPCCRSGTPSNASSTTSCSSQGADPGVLEADGPDHARRHGRGKAHGHGLGPADLGRGAAPRSTATSTKRAGSRRPCSVSLSQSGKAHATATALVRGLYPQFTRRSLVVDFLMGILPFILLYPLRARWGTCSCSARSRRASAGASDSPFPAAARCLRTWTSSSRPPACSSWKATA